MLLHTPTLFALIVLVSLVLAAALFYIGFRRQAVLRLWALALGLSAVTHGLFVLRNHLPDLLGLLIPNVALAISYAVLAEGIFRFQERQPPRVWLWLPVPLVALLVAWQAHDILGRILGIALLSLVQLAVILHSLWQRRLATPGRGQHLLLIGVVALMLIYVLRAFLALVAPEQVGSIAGNHLGQAVGFTLSIVSLMLVAMGMVVMLEERTEQTLEQAAERLSASERHYRTLIEAANEGICVLHEGRVRYANPRLYALTGYRADQIIDEPFLRFLHDDDRRAALETHQRRLHGLAEHDTQEVRILTAHRGVRWFEVSGVRYEWHGEPATLNFVDDITERKQREAQVLDYAYRDALTELPNRRALLERLPTVLDQLHVSGQHGALLFLDLDNFKPLNDLEGHSVGDLLLVEVARRLRLALRPHDLVARLGGDEFVAVLTHLDPDEAKARQQALELAERLRERLNQPYTLSLWRDDTARRIEHRCTVSVGVRLFRGNTSHLAQLLDAADHAMYQAKQAGRDRVVFSASPESPPAPPT